LFRAVLITAAAFPSGSTATATPSGSVGFNKGHQIGRNAPDPPVEGVSGTGYTTSREPGIARERLLIAPGRMHPDRPR